MAEPPPPPEPPEGAPPPPGSPGDPATRPGLCPNCGAPHDAYQEYCLECGRRLPGARIPGAYTEIWSRDSPIWLWAALAALLLVALVAGAVVALAANDNGDKQGQPGPSLPVSTTIPPTTSTAPTQPETITINPPPTTSTQGTTTFSTTTLGTTFQTTTSSANTTWPPGKNGYTVVLKSVPTSKGRTQAEAAADRARQQGLAQVGVLNSSDFSSMNPGYYVTFSGIYDTQSQADAALPNARNRGFPTAYVRQVAD